ncbi:MAG: helix-turn-helix transcriptional regulator [Firmicutes bacterium]|nr:helix-turn-helix transcriptional regulator [Bacillota bacterium]
MRFDIDEFTERLKTLRESKNLTTVKLGKALGISGATISRWENGKRKPNVENIYNIADFFRITSDYLIGLKQKT